MIGRRFERIVTRRGLARSPTGNVFVADRCATGVALVVVPESAAMGEAEGRAPWIPGCTRSRWTTPRASPERVDCRERRCLSSDTRRTPHDNTPRTAKRAARRPTHRKAR
ncbi:hypothetical protein WS70_18130 [Burkholderia mayonis]|uniref:Uncharacterized protein n=1 Tax=Burkholderia mayonis TaxID=1385591 RepID=A0A1B4FJI6_9BURK|nr:hypothetical protein WS70_18130 [Burkholderia mayonis]